MLFISGEKGAITGDIHTSFLCRHIFDHNKIPMRRDDFWVEEREKKEQTTLCVCSVNGAISCQLDKSDMCMQ